MFSKLSPKLKRVLTLSLGIGVIIFIVVVFNPSIDTKKKNNERLIKHVLTDFNTREVGVESLAAHLKLLQKQNQDYHSQLEKVKKELELIKKNAELLNLNNPDNPAITAKLSEMQDSINEFKVIKSILPKSLLVQKESELKKEERFKLNKKDNLLNEKEKIKITQELTQIKAKMAILEEITKQNKVVTNISEAAKESVFLPKNSFRTIRSIRDISITSSNNLKNSSNDNKLSNILNNETQGLDIESNGVGNNLGNRDTLFKGENVSYDDLINDPDDYLARAKNAKNRRLNEPKKGQLNQSSNLTSNNSKHQKSAKDAYIPSGSILSGMIITGVDAPTKENAKNEPFPILINLTDYAILPNNLKFDLKECFLIGAAYGDMSSERIYMRTENLSCILKNGEVIESKINGYATGEDGKAGIRGRLVSKQGKLIARSLMSGFLEGLAGAFDVNPVPVINTSSSETVEYQKVYSSNALRGAAVAGSSKALERIAHFYLKLAQEMFPVLEIDAGREVDIVITQGFNFVRLK